MRYLIVVFLTVTLVLGGCTYTVDPTFTPTVDTDAVVSCMAAIALTQPELPPVDIALDLCLQVERMKDAGDLDDFYDGIDAIVNPSRVGNSADACVGQCT